MPLHWGIASAGRITHDFVTAMRTIPGENHEVVAVSDPDPERASLFAKKHSIRTFYKGFETMAKANDVEIVYVGTINPFHYAVTRLFLEHGKNVLCEKPLCLSHKEAEDLYTLAKNKNVFLMEGMWSRFFPSYEYLKNFMGTDEFGEPVRIEACHGFVAKNVERIMTKSLGGGITLDIGIYTVQLAQLLFKGFPTKIRVKGTLNEEGIDIESEIEMEYEGGRTLSAKVSALKNYVNDAKIIGTKGTTITLHDYWCCPAITCPDGTAKKWPLPGNESEYNHTNAAGLCYEAECVRNCLEKGLKECPLYTHEESLNMIKIEDEIRRQLGVDYTGQLLKYTS